MTSIAEENITLDSYIDLFDETAENMAASYVPCDSGQAPFHPLITGTQPALTVRKYGVGLEEGRWGGGVRLFVCGFWVWPKFGKGPHLKFCEACCFYFITIVCFFSSICLFGHNWTYAFLL